MVTLEIEIWEPQTQKIATETLLSELECEGWRCLRRLDILETADEEEDDDDAICVYSE